nr:DUF262 domain-containing protein [Sneathiella limimaris]
MKISTILDHLDSGHMALPEFQRGYVWNKDQVRGLMDSLYRRHPIGGLLVWVTKSETASHRGDGPLAAGVVKLLLDGQQRITTLYGNFRPQSEPYPSEPAKLKRFAGALIIALQISDELPLDQILGCLEEVSNEDAIVDWIIRNPLKIKQYCWSLHDWATLLHREIKDTLNSHS